MKLYLLAPTLLATITGGIPKASAQTSPQDCLFGWTQLGFSAQDFDRYSAFFHADSTITLSQAGSYTGPDAIEEYVRFATPTSPYVAAQGEEGAFAVGLKDIDQNICIFYVHQMVDYHMDGDLVGEDPPSIKVPVLFHLYFDAAENYIPVWNVYYKTPYLEYIFGLLNAPGVSDFLCGTMKNSCGFDVDVDGGCRDRLAELPVLTGNGYFDGADFGCRALHGVFAASNTDHCAHISFEPMADPQGNVKCQESLGRQPSDFFDEGDLDEFDKFCAENGVDPALGYRVLAPSCVRHSNCVDKAQCKGHNNQDKRCRMVKEDCKAFGTKHHGRWGCRNGKQCSADGDKKWGICLLD